MGTPQKAAKGAAAADHDRRNGRSPARTVLIETAWEACNQVGGIYTVLRSRAPTMTRRWRGRYIILGPYVPAQAAAEFEDRPATGWVARAIQRMADDGLVARHGVWLIPGRPRAILLETAGESARIDQFRRELRAAVGVEPPRADPLVDAVIAFASAQRRALRALTAEASAAGADDRPGRLLAHFHEWMGGLCLPLVKRDNPALATAFTTHATLLGRYLASSDAGFYKRLKEYDPGAEAERFGIAFQHGVERACAAAAGVFTTVSPITAEECAALLGRRPDAVTPNGLNIDQYTVGHEFQTLHAHFKESIHRFTMGMFFPSYSFDLDNTLYFFTSGRFEVRNKGFDLCLEAAARLNERLKAAQSNQTVVFFLVTSRKARSLHPRLLESRGVLNELHGVCSRIARDLGEELFRRAAAGSRASLDDLVDEYWGLRFRRTQQALRTDAPPLTVTHALDDEASDEVLAAMRALGLRNLPDDPVKIVYHPEFISPVNPLWGIEYEQFVRGCHLGVFPSAYEPWGYTPLECVAMGVPAITSDLAGFGRYVQETMPDHDDWGLRVLRRRDRARHKAVEELTDHLHAFCRMGRRERVALRNEVEKRSLGFDWSRLAGAYHAAHSLAMERSGVA